MTRFSIAIALTAGLVTAAPASAQFINSFRDPQLPVNQLTATTFEVIERRGAGARDIWCAAARHAIYDLGQTRGRIYIARARGPAQTVGGAKGVAFTTRDTGTATDTGVSVTTRVVGANLPVNHAVQFCRDYAIEPGDVLP